MSERDKVISKIRALLSKTVENGCTEAEALSALSMAQAMMDAYEVTEADLNEMRQESAIKETMKDMRDPHHIRAHLTVAISRFTNTKVWRHEYKSQKWRYNFVGLRSDVDFALWLTETLTMFVQRELKNYIWKNDYTGLEPSTKRKVINGFVFGACNRISERMIELADNSEDHASKNANALVVIKNELIVKKMNELGIELRSPRQRGSAIKDDAYQAGKAVGDKANFGRPMGGEAGMLRLK